MLGMYSEKEVREFFAESTDQTGLTAEEILAGYNLTINDVIEINDQTGMEIGDILDLYREF